MGTPLDETSPSHLQSREKRVHGHIHMYRQDKKNCLQSSSIVTNPLIALLWPLIFHIDRQRSYRGTLLSLWTCRLHLGESAYSKSQPLKQFLKSNRSLATCHFSCTPQLGHDPGSQTHHEIETPGTYTHPTPITGHLLCRLLDIVAAKGRRLIPCEE